jgi:transcriptional regulator with XRE-family HTH domain
MDKTMMGRGPKSTDTHVGTQIRLRRLELDISQQDLGHAVGCTFQQIQKYENAKNRVSASRLWRLAQVLSVPIGYFFEGLPGDPDARSYTPSLAHELTQKPYGFDVMQSAAGCNDTGRRSLANIARQLAEICPADGGGA